MIYAYSDTHFNHRNIILYCNRRDDWQERFLATHRRVVGPNDTVLFLGDLGFGPAAKMREILSSLQFSRFVAILGNHDRNAKWLLESGVTDVIKEPGQRLQLDDSEYPIEVVLIAANGPTDYVPGSSLLEGFHGPIAISHEPYYGVDPPYLRGHTHNHPVPWDYCERPLMVNKWLGRNVSVEMLNFTPIPVPFLIGDQGWTARNHQAYYKHLFGFDGTRKRTDPRKDV